MSITVATQAELDTALASGADYIDIKSPAGVWLEVVDTGSATVTACDSATVTATPCVAVHLHSATATVSGGVVIDVSKPITDPRDWSEHHGVRVSRAGIATGC